MKISKLWLYIFFVVLVLSVFLYLGKKKGWIGNKGQIEVYAENAKLRDIVETVSANGKVQPEVQVKISSDVSGEVVELYVKEGDEVKAGDLLAKINPELYMASLDRMSATLSSAKANLANMEARLNQSKVQLANNKISFERSDKLLKQGVISQSEFDQARTLYESTKADVEAAQQGAAGAKYNVQSTEASLKEARQNLTRTSIYAPVSGIISKLNVEKGERVVGTTQFTGTEMMVIANLNEMEVTVQVNENDIVRVNLHDTADVEIDAYLNRKFKGVVTEIATSANSTGATSSDQVTNFDVKIRILRESYIDLAVGKPASYSPFRPGMSATVDIKTKRVSKVVSIPIQAITVRPDTTINEEMKDGKKSKPKDNNGEGEGPGSENVQQVADKSDGTEMQEYVFVYEGGVAVRKPVKTGIQDNMYMQILEGLKAGEQVICGPYGVVSKSLQHNQPVVVVDKKKLFEKIDKK